MNANGLSPFIDTETYDGVSTFNFRTMPHKSPTIDPHRFIVNLHNSKRKEECGAEQTNKNNSGLCYEHRMNTRMLPHSNNGVNARVMKSKRMPLKCK